MLRGKCSFESLCAHYMLHDLMLPCWDCHLLPLTFPRQEGLSNLKTIPSGYLNEPMLPVTDKALPFSLSLIRAVLTQKKYLVRAEVHYPFWRKQKHALKKESLFSLYFNSILNSISHPFSKGPLFQKN